MIIISDLHLGNKNCQRDALLRFLDQTNEYLIINGDLIDYSNLRNLNEVDFKILEKLRSKPVLWLGGNHDPELEIIRFLGFQTGEHHQIGKNIVIHGHQFDGIMGSCWATRATTWLAQFSLVRNIEMGLRDNEKISKLAREWATDLGSETVICGHTHLPANEPGYINTGCWLDSDSLYYVKVTEEAAELVKFV